MVLRCRGSSHEIYDSALNRVTKEALDSPFYSVTSSNSAPAQKAIGNKRDDQMVTFILNIHSYSYVNEVELFVKQIDADAGVKRVKCDGNSIKLEVTGIVDPLKVQRLFERETKKKVELFFPTVQLKGDTDKSNFSEENLKNGKKMIQMNGIASEKTEESIFDLKVKLCCDYCNQKLKKILKFKGLETVTMDVEKDLVTVKGTVDMTEVQSYIKGELKKDVIIFPAEVVFPTKNDDGAAYKKEKDCSIIRKIDRNDESTNRKDKGNNAAPNKKCRGTVSDDENFKVSSIFHEKIEGISAVDEKTKGIGAIDVKDRDTTPIDQKLMGSATIDDKYKDRGKYKHKDYVFNDEKDKGSVRDTKYKALGDRCDGKKDEDGGAMRKENPKIYPVYDERKVNSKVYDYNDHNLLTYSNGLDQMFSDENPNSCCIM